MVKDLTVFQHEQFGSIRGVVINDEPWLVGKDVAEVLGYADTNKAVAMHVDPEDKLNDKTALSLGQRGGWLINESGLYSLVLSSKLPTAKQFKRWVTAEVLPTIRKTGGYVDTDELFIDTYLPHADDGTKAMFRAQLRAQRETNRKLSEMSPKADYYDRLIDHGNSLSIRDTSKSIGVKESVLKNLLIEHKFLYRDRKNRLRPYAEKNKGYFELKEFTTETGNYASVQTLVTVEGRQMLLKLLGREEGKEQAV